MAISAAALESALAGAWAVHRTRNALLGDSYRRWPTSHIFFGASGWELLWTGFEWRFGGCGVSAGTWNVITTADARALLVLTVKSRRPSRAHRAGIALSDDMVVAGAEAQSEREARLMRDGQVRTYFLPLELHDRAIVMALPSDGRLTPTQRWTRAEITWPRPEPDARRGIRRRGRDPRGGVPGPAAACCARRVVSLPRRRARGRQCRISSW